MSYPTDLEDYTTKQLLAEISKRDNSVSKGLCPYCGFDIRTHTCKHKSDVDKYHLPAGSDMIVPPVVVNHSIEDCKNKFRNFPSVNFGGYPVDKDGFTTLPLL